MWRRLVAVAVLVVYAVALVLHRDELISALELGASLSAVEAAALGAAAVLLVLTAGLTTRAVTPGLSGRQGVMVHQATTAATYTVVASGPTSVGIRVAMLHGWGVDPHRIGLTVVALNVLGAYKLWISVLVVAALGAAGAADGVADARIFPLAGAVAVVVLGASSVLWWLLLRHPTLADALALRAQRLLPRLRRRIRRLPELDLPALAVRLRSDARALVQGHGWAIGGAAVLELAVLILLPVVAVRVAGIDASTVPAAQVVLVFGLVRMAAAFSPVPGGIGVTELGLSVLLVRAGAAEPAAVAAIVAFRAVTFLLPLLLGTLCFACWRWSRRRSRGEVARTAPAVRVPLPTAG